MKMLMNGLSAVMIAAGLMGAAYAGESVPKGYYGEFRDSANGATASIGKKEVKLTLPGGSSFKAKPEELSIKNLTRGEANAYLSKHESDGDLLDFFWVLPIPNSRHEEGPFVWYGAELIQGLMDKDMKDPVANVELFHCREGYVVIDVPTKRWEIGCPAGPDFFQLLRTQ